MRCVGDDLSFFAHHWARRPLYRRGAGSEGFLDLFSPKAVDHIVSATLLRLHAFRLVKDGQTVDPRTYLKSAHVGSIFMKDVADAGRIYSHFHDGATIVLQALQRYWPPLTDFCRELELVFTHPVQANAYISPPGSKGLDVHYDTHDVFVLQVSGSKQWNVYEPQIEAPLLSQRFQKADDLGSPLISCELKPGDCLYIPRGFLHSALANEDGSSHLTVGILSYTWNDVIREILNETTNDLAFRESLPIGFAKETADFTREVVERVGMLKLWLDTVDVNKIAAHIRRKFWSSRAPMLEGQLEQLVLLKCLDDKTVVRRRKGSICELSADEDDGALKVLLGDRELKMPASLESVMRLIIAKGTFSVGELAEDLDEESRQVLVRRLIREGLLEAIVKEGNLDVGLDRHLTSAP